MKSILRLTAALILSFTCVYTSNAQDALRVKRLKKDVNYLADDKLEGRGTGSKGEQMASKYIIKTFKKLGLTPAGTSGYLQAFTISTKPKVTAKNHLIIEKTVLEYEKHFVSLPISGNGNIEGMAIEVGYGIHAPELNYSDYDKAGSVESKIAVVKIGNPENNPHSKYTNFDNFEVKVRTAAKMGAKGVIFISSDYEETAKLPIADRTSSTSTIPVGYLTKEGFNLYKSESARTPATIHFETELIRNKVDGHNVVGYLDNHANTTIIIGAHYDHLGYGEEGGSLFRGKKSVHNGADDNASGTAGLMELARIFSAKKLSKNNLLFIAFSGEEMGLLGSNFFAKNPTLHLTNVNCMLNMDMIGRLDSGSRVLGINGVGTSPEWKTLVDSFTYNGLKIKTTESGVGSSDHTSFYLKDIPVLHFFSGTHGDYHKPSDDAEKLNYTAQAEIVEYIEHLTRKIDATPRLGFSKTTDKDSRSTPRFTVTMGIIPDYLYEGIGVKVDGVSDEKPAMKAGVKTSDIIVKIGDFDITDMHTYMDALSKLKKGEKTKVTLIRGKETMELPITF